MLFVDGISFLLTVEIILKFVTVEHTPVSTAMEINLCREINSIGTATYSSTIDLGFLRTVSPLTLARSGPNIAQALDTSIE